MITLQALRQRRGEILELADRHGANDVRVFGSLARGTGKESSDVDFLVHLEASRSLFDLGALVMDLHDLLQMEVDVVSDGSLYGRFGQIVSAEAVRL